MPGPVNDLRTLWTIVSNGVLEQSEVLWERSSRYVSDLWKAFPNPYKMVDLTVAYASGLIGLVVTLPIAGFQRHIRTSLEAVKLHNKLIRVDDAFDLFFNAWKNMANTITLTGESSILTMLATWFGRFLWKLRGKVKLIALVIRSKTETELIHNLVLALERKAVFFRTVAIALAVVYVTFMLAVLWWLVSLTFYCAFSPEAFSKVLRQDSKRVYRKKRVQHRVNARPGPDG